MAKGGKREGAGRPPGKQSAKTEQRAAIAQIAASAGTTPLDMMLEIMRELRQAAVDAYASEDEDTRKNGLKYMMLAATVAKDAAPYINPKLAAIEHTGKDGKDLAGPTLNLTLNK